VDPEVGGSSPPSCTIEGRAAINLTCFKTYDVRGRVGYDLDESIAYRIGRAFAQILNAKNIAVGSDARLSGPALKAALIEGILDAGANAIDLGLSGTEEIYFASSHLDVDGGVEVTASHNPADYNGMKFVGKNGRPIGIDDEFVAIRRLAEADDFAKATKRGCLSQHSILQPYAKHLLSYIDPPTLPPLKLVVDSGNGAAGHVIDALEKCLPQIQFIKINHAPDGNFPNGVPNPLLPERRAITTAAVIDNNADLGIAWDGDFDRCFLFDGTGAYVSGYYVAGLLMSAFIAKSPNEKFIVDPRLVWNTLDVMKDSSAEFKMSRTGHTFFKQRMREVDAIYGGETSAHHYFRDFAYCDSGMIPWLLVVEYLGLSGKSLAQVVAVRKTLFPCSEEINFEVADVSGTIDHVMNHYRSQALSIDQTDGLSLAFENWRFNLRGSNTEALLRLNLESRGDATLLREKTFELTDVINAWSS
jgi:phosphomannomutase